jgi:DNA-binding MarR family transcriptional regulator
VQPSPRSPLIGDLLAQARHWWLREMAARLGARGYPGYRRSDASVLRSLRRDELTIGQLGASLGVTRQAARHVLDGLEARGYARATRDTLDTRRVRIVLTPKGLTYANAVVDVVHALNHEVAERLDPYQLDATREVLRAIVDMPSSLGVVS